MIPLIKWPIRRPGSLIPVFFLSICQITSGQFAPPGVESAGLAGCYSMLSGHSSIAGNQAGLGWEQEKSLNAEFIMPFMIKELGMAGISLSHPLYHGNIAAKLISAGIPGYRHQSLWLSYGLRAGKNFTTGAGLFYNLISIRGELNHQIRISFAGGIQVKINDHFLLGGHILYPLQYSSSNSEYGRLKASLAIGVSYEFYMHNKLYGECRLDAESNPSISAGIESTIGEVVTIRAGYQTYPGSFSLGSCFRISRIHILFASHVIISYGLSSSIGICYEL